MHIDPVTGGAHVVGRSFPKDGNGVQYSYFTEINNSIAIDQAHMLGELHKRVINSLADMYNCPRIFPANKGNPT
jgi:hypothetical protein